MESGERLASPPSASSSVPSASSTATATAPSKGSLSTGATALSSTLTSCGHLFRAAGDQPFTLSTVSSAFPMVNHPAFGLYTTSSGRSEFGGLGTLGASAALATHPQLGPFPEWWRTSDAHARAGAAFFPPLLGIPPLFAAPVQNHDSSSFQSRTASKNGRGAQKGMNGAVNGSSITLPSGVNTSATAVTVLGSSGQTKVANSSGRDRKCNQEQTNSQLHDKAADKPKDKVLMQNVKENTKDGQKAVEDKEPQDKKTNQQQHFASDPETLKQPQVLSQQLPLVFQSSEAKEETGKKHLSVIHSTGLTATTKPLALVTQARREASPKPLIPSLEILNTGNKNTTEEPGSQINDLRLKQEQFKLAFPVQLKKQQELYKNQKKVASALSSPKPTTDSPASQKLTPANSNHSNLFLSNTLLGHHQPNGVIQSAIQDAPLALTTKSRSQPKPNDKQVLNSSSTSSPSPVNLCTSGKNHSSNQMMPTRPSTSPALSRVSGKDKAIGAKDLLKGGGWHREARIREIGGRLQGEVAYYAPCGKKLRQYPEVMKYLTRNGITDITRDNFSFSAKIRVGDFYEARDGPQGMQWSLLNKEEVLPRIRAMEGRRGRPPNPERTRSGDGSRMRRRKGRPPNVGASDILSNTDAKLIRKLEAQETARQAAQIKLMRKHEKQALARAAKEARKQQAIMAAEERRKQKEQMKILKQQEKIKRIQQIRMEKELRAQQILEAKRKKKEEAANAKISEAEKRTKERERRRQHMMLLKAMDARKKAEEKERLKQEKKDEKRLNKERKLELRRLELEIAKELKKPNEDMCLADHKPLPELNRISGLVLSGSTFSDCLMVVQFLRNFGKVLGFDISVDVPHLSVLQEGLLNVGDSMGEVQDLLVRLLSAVVCDPGLPPGCRAKTALGDHLTNIGINRDNVSEILQIYMEAHCGQTELTESLETKAFQAHTPTQKASILAFLVNELACSKSVVSEIDKNIDHMSNLRRDKWIVEGKLRKLRIIHAKKTGKRDMSGCVDGGEEQALGTPTPERKRKRKGGDSDDDDDDDDDDSEEQGDEEEDDEDDGKKGKKVEACEDEDDGYQTTSVEELEKQIEKLTKQQSQFRRKLFEASHSLRSMMFGQDRYKRRYWVLPQCGGVFVEALESGEAPPLVSGSLQNPVGLNPFALSALQMKPGLHLMGLPFCGWPSGMLSPNLPFTSSPLPHALNSGFGAMEGNSNPFLAASISTSKSESPMPQNEKPPSAPSPAIEVAKPVDYPCPRPIPEEMQTGWWRVTDAEELRTLAKVLHLRGIREKALQKQIQKHMDYISQACSKNRDVAIMEINDNEENQVTQETLESWCVEEQAMDMDIAILQQVEELERRVASASLQVKGWIYPEPHSEREDLVYYEHKPFSKLQPEEDNVGEKQDCSDSSIVRHINNPLDIAVTRLAELERNIERRGEEDIAPGLKVWRKALSEVRSAAQVALCIQQLQKSIAWEKSIMKVYCQICRKGDNEELLLLCDGCDKGCHTYCHRPKITTIPEGDWFCPACIAKASGQSPRSKIRGVRKGNDMKCSKKLSVAGDVSEDDAASTSSTPKKGGKEPKKRKGDENTSLNQTKQENSSCVKKAKTARDNAKDLALCSLILSELETHEDAWPFLLPVNLKLVSGYKKVIKKPMAFATIREKLDSSQIFPSITLKMATLICSLVDHSDDVNWCAFSTTCLATCSLDKTIRLYSIKDFSELPFSPLNGHGYAVHSCCFSSTGGLLASCSTDGTTVLWSMNTGEIVTVLQHPGRSPVRICTFSPDSSCLVSGAADGTVALWAVHSNTLCRYVTACAFAPDMPLIATGSMDKTVTIWRLEDGTSFGGRVSQQSNKCSPVSNATAKKKFDSQNEEEKEKNLDAGFLKAQSRLCVSEWSEEAVSVWLCEEGLDELVNIFKANNIDGSELLSLNKEIVTNDLNIESLGLCNKVIRKIEELKEHLESVCTGIPGEFLCPINRELMKDPVIASDGYSYEREAIESWIHTKKHSSPMTNLPLKSVLLTPNRTLKMAISSWKNCQ
ncbi:UNVERIFIED_CONTAM: hypothetical protein FKN15_014045 [Acipenser sinensis]